MAPSPSIERIHTDVLIIGAGAAGLRAAIETRKKNVDVLIVCKGKVGRSGATFYPSSPTRGIQASSGIGIDTVDRHIQDVLNVGLGEADYNLAQILASWVPRGLVYLLTFGVGLAKRDGEIIREPGCFSKVPRAAIIENVGDFASCLINNVSRMGGMLYEQ